MYCIQSGHVQTQHSQVPLLATSYTANKAGRKVRLSYAIAFQSTLLGLLHVAPPATPLAPLAPLILVMMMVMMMVMIVKMMMVSPQSQSTLASTNIHTLFSTGGAIWWRGCWIFYCLLALLFLLLFDLLA